MEPSLKELRQEVIKVKRMFLSHTHKMSRDECNWLLNCYKDLYKPVVSINQGKPPKPKVTRLEEYDF